MPTINRKIIRPKRIKYKTEGNHAKFYNSKAWKLLRKSYITEHPLCENCLKNGIIKPAKEVHHKQIFSTANTEEGQWNIFLDGNNLMSLCIKCHHMFHDYAKKHNLNYIDYLEIENDKKIFNVKEI